MYYPGHNIIENSSPDISVAIHKSLCCGNPTLISVGERGKDNAWDM